MTYRQAYRQEGAIYTWITLIPILMKEWHLTNKEMQELLIKTDLLKYIDVAYEMLNSTGITGVIEELEDYVRLRGCKIVEVNETR